MKKTKLILVGGFLGAGKTTLLWHAARLLIQKGYTVGLITNDQAPELVDSKLLALNGLETEEVSGSCFCCNFNGFTEAIQKLNKKKQPDIILAEPVGSCTDLSATIIQPLKQHWNAQLDVCSLSVVADPFRLSSLLQKGTSGLHPDAAYIVDKQFEECDMLLINKTDLLDSDELSELYEKAHEVYPYASIRTLSALTDAGIESWLDEVIENPKSGLRIVDVDYDTYAHGEAVLGWLNGTLSLSGEAQDWNRITHNLLNELAAEFDKQEMAVGHVKVIAEEKNSFTIGNLTGKSDTLVFRNKIDDVDRIHLTINARVESTPEQLNQIIEQCLTDHIPQTCNMEILAWKYLQPGRPDPTYRYDRVVS